MPQQIAKPFVGGIDLNVAWSKYNKYKNETYKFLKSLKMLDKLCNIKEFKEEIENLENNYKNTFSLLDLSIYINKLDNKTIECPFEIYKEFIEKYIQIKKQCIIYTPIKILIGLKDIDIKDEIIAGRELYLYNYFNISSIYDNVENKDYFILVIEKMLDICINIYCIFMQPDIDMTSIINIGISEIEKTKARDPTTKTRRGDRINTTAVDIIKDTFMSIHEDPQEYYKKYVYPNQSSDYLQNQLMKL